MSLFSRIKETSKEQGLLLKEVADKIGTTAGNMTRWDTNRPSVDKVVSVAQILNVSVDYLVGLTDEKKPVPTDGNGPDSKIVSFLLGLPKDRLRGILLALGAPKEVLDELDQQEPPK